MQAHEKMLNIVSYQGHVNQNHNEILPHICQNGYHQKNPQITNLGKDVEKREPLCTVDGNVNWCSHCGKRMEVFQKTRNRTTI